MTPSEYREFCLSTYAAPAHVDREEYLSLLLIEEVGEVASLFAKAMRDGHEVDRDRLKKELGDVMWCAACLGCMCEWSEYGASGYVTWKMLDFASGKARMRDANSLCYAFGFMPEEVALANVEKLKGRVARGTIHGSGDER